MSKTDKQHSRKDAGDRAHKDAGGRARDGDRKQEAERAEPVEQVPLSKRLVLLGAVDSFIRANTNFESSVPINAAIDAMEGLSTREAIFSEPLQRQMFNLEAALRWALFMEVAPARAVEEGDPAFADEFTASKSLALVSGVYDVGVQEAVWEHFEDSDSESDEEDEGEEDKEHL